MYLSIVVPCYNEERNIRLGALEKIAHYLKKKTYEWEVILVDDGSTDESKRLIKEFLTENPGFKLIENKHKGKAATVISGMLIASGEYVLFSDLDQATPIDELDHLLIWGQKGCDIVIGSRNKKRRGAPLFRLAMARGFMILRNMVLNLNIKDTQCGFKLFRKYTIKPIFSKLHLYSNPKTTSGSTVTAGFDVEMLFIAQRLGYNIKEVPVEWHYQETRHVNPLKDSFEGLFDLIIIRLNTYKEKYN